MKFLPILAALTAAMITTTASAELDSLGGYKLGDSCDGSEFTTMTGTFYGKDSKGKTIYSNKIEAPITISKRVTDSGHTVFARCSVIDNKVFSVYIEVEGIEKGKALGVKVMEEMGRGSDDKQDSHIRANIIAGVKYDERYSLWHTWELGNNVKVVYTFTGKRKYDSHVVRNFYRVSLSEWMGSAEYDYLKKNGVKTENENNKDELKDLF